MRYIIKTHVCISHIYLRNCLVNGNFTDFYIVKFNGYDYNLQ